MLRRVLPVILALWLLVPGAGAMPASAAPGDPTPNPAPHSLAGGSQVVHINFTTEAQLAELAGRLDLWEAHRDQGYVVAYVSPEELAWLQSAGYTYEVNRRLSQHPDTIPGAPCYRTINELYAQLQTWAGQYPQITDLVPLGLTYEKRQLEVLRISNKSRPGQKPAVFIMANIHGREVITPETAMEFVRQLLQGYGSDPDITWLVDDTTIHVLVSANPDGHVRNEPGYPWAYWRKNVAPYGYPGTCSAGTYGVDLNRNSTYRWGYDGYGSSGWLCDETYRGPAAGSESETVAIENYVRTLYAPQSGVGSGTPAAPDTSGVFITLHSYGNDVLWPWGWTTQAPPNVAALAMFGRKLATFNGYTAAQSDSPVMYPTNGTTDDWAYAQFGVAAYTIEIGSDGDGFYPACSNYNSLIQPNVAALLYAAKVARAPYQLSYGPDARSLSAIPLPNTSLVQVQATVNDANNGQQGIAAAEAYVDTPPWAGGMAYPLAAADGQFDQVNEVVQGQIPANGLTVGRHTIFVRGRDAGGNWGPVAAEFLTVQGSQARGFVTAAGGPALPAATVTYTRTTGPTYRATTAGDGAYALSLPAGTYTAAAALWGYLPQTDAGLVVPVNGTLVHDFTLAPAPSGMLRGTVTDLASHEPLTATVAAAGTPAHTTTDATGAYTLTLPAGSYTIVAHGPGHGPVVRSGQVIMAGQSTTLDFALPAGRFAHLPLVSRLQP